MSESETTQIGDIIRRRRSELGLSPAELGDIVGRTGSTVRRWEKNDAAPPAAMLTALAEALELDRGALVKVGSGESDTPEPVVTRKPVVETPEPVVTTSEPDAKAPEPPPKTSQPPVQRPQTPQPPQAERAASEAVKPQDPRPAQPRRPPPSAPQRQPTARPTPPPVTGAPIAVPPSSAPTPSRSITEEPTEVMAAPSAQPRVEPIAEPRPVRTRPTPTAPRAPVSYLEDPKERYRYFLRWLLTGAAIVVMLFILAWAFTELREALGDVWDLFQQEPTETTVVGVDLSG